MRKVLPPLVLALVTFAAPAWAMGGHNKGNATQSDADKAAAAKKAKETERAYQEALKKIPDAKPNNDPWSKVR